jgi:N-methylhydantoinase B
MAAPTRTPDNETFDSIRTAVMANKIDGIVREMTNTLLRSARSAVINSARDFSCAIVTGNNELLACAEGLPVHIVGAQLQAQALSDAHPDLREGDAFLDNNPYEGNSHAADHTILVPVFVEGEHIFTAVAKAHQADIGNSVPTTYFAGAKDVYEEGALIFPTVQVQRDYKNIDDIIAICQARIRVPSQWYGDFLAAIGAARIAERRLKEMCAKYGLETIKLFIRDWLDYSEQRMTKAIESLPAATLTNSGMHDPFLPYLPDGLAFNVTIKIIPEEGRIHVDLTDNIPNVDCGLNMTEATTRAAVLAGIYNAIEAKIPKNSGAFRRVHIDMNHGSAVGKPLFPHSCSVATTNVTDRLINCVGAAFAQLGAPYGLAEGAVGIGVGLAVISGKDRRNGEAFVNQIVMSANGGPGSAKADGWVTYGIPCISGLMNRDSIEIDEIKMPIRYKHMKAIPNSGGAGKFRGGPSFDVAFTPAADPVMVIYPCDGQIHPPKGAAGGAAGKRAESWLQAADGTRTRLANNATLTLSPGETIQGFDCSGGGYGDPFERDPQLVLHDVNEGWESPEYASETYGVEFRHADGGLEIDDDMTARRRQAAKLR